MSKRPSTPTRISGDVASLAALIAPVEHRTATEQINHWARIGMQLERNVTAHRRRILEAAAGTRQFADLDPDEREAAHALIDADIAERASTEHFGARHRVVRGERTVALDDDGNLIEIAADGTTRPL